MPKPYSSADIEYSRLLTNVAKLCYTNSHDLVEDLKNFFPESYQRLEKEMLNKETSTKLGVLLASTRRQSAA